MSGTSCEHRLVPLTQADHSNLHLEAATSGCPRASIRTRIASTKRECGVPFGKQVHQANIVQRIADQVVDVSASVVGPAVHLEASPEQSNVIALQMLHGLQVDFCKV
jgi:hypothetical protein